jgi:hypothetical protein
MYKEAKIEKAPGRQKEIVEKESGNPALTNHKLHVVSPLDTTHVHFFGQKVGLFEIAWTSCADSALHM